MVSTQSTYIFIIITIVIILKWFVTKILENLQATG